MNKSYRLIYNEITNTWVAVAETVRGRGKRTSGALLLVAAGVMMPLVQAPAWAGPPGAVVSAPAPTQLPTGGQVVAGQASLNQIAATLNVNQSSNRAAIDWATFNVGSQAQVNFKQPSVSSVTLNRVLDANPSQIFGHINANGQVFLSNPNGVYFSPTASVDVGALVATTHSISNDDFMAGGNSFARNGATGSVVNEGELKAALGGYIALLAPEVRNKGVIVAQLGTVVLAAGEAYELQFDNNRLANIRVEPATIAALVENGNAVLAPGGLVILSARAADQLQGSVVRNSGSIEAGSLVERGGRIVLTGDHITLASGSKLDASGASGGGEVLVGGGWQGSGGLYQATTVTMEQGASIDVSATKAGAGGTAVLWSDVHNAASVTQVEGSIAAKAAGTGGGGRVETSGHTLRVGDLSVNAQATNGQDGLWLLDPYNITISTAANASTALLSNQFTASASGGVVNATTLQNALASNAVTVSTAGAGADTGNITVDTNLTWSSAQVLSLAANGGVSGSGNIAMTGGTGAGVVFNQSGNSSYSGIVSGANATLAKSGAGTLTLTGASTYAGATNVNGGTLKISGAGKIYSTTGSDFGFVSTAVTTVNTGAVLELTDWAWGGNFGTQFFDASALVINGGTLRYSGATTPFTSSYGRGFTVGNSGATFDSATAAANWSLYSYVSLNPTYKSVFGGPVTFTGAGDFTFSHIITGSSTVTKSGAGTATLQGANTYTGATTISAGTLVLANDAPVKTSSGYSGAGALRIEPLSNDFTGDFSTSGWIFGPTLGGLTIGKASSADGTSDKAVTIPTAISIAGPISIYGGSFAPSVSLTTTNPGAAILLQVSGGIDTANSGAFSLNTNNGAVSVIADSNATGSGSIYFSNETINPGTGNVILRGKIVSPEGATINGTGTVTFESSDASFGSAFDTSTVHLATTLTGLTVGKSTNTKNVTVPSSLSIAGPISIYGGSLFMNGNLTSTASTGGNVLLQGSGDVLMMGNVQTAGSFTATAGASNSLVMGLNYATGAGSTISADGGVTISAPTSYLAGNVTTSNAAISITGNLQVANLASNPSTTPLTLASGNGSITLSGGTVSAYSGSVQDYALLTATTAKSITGSAVGLASLSGGYLLNRYTTTGSDIFYTPYGLSSVDYLVVAGGGGGGTGDPGMYTGGGGGGGGVADGSYALSGVNSLNLVVGAGGAQTTTGGDTSLGSILAGGGGGGGNYNGASGLVGRGGAGYAAGGGGGGAGSTWPGSSIASGASGGQGSQTGRSGGSGGASGSPDGAWGGAGGGAGGNASTRAGGAGIASSITGSSVTYGAALTGTSGNYGAATANTGTGGGPQYFATTVPGAAGTVIVRYTVGNATRAAGSTLKLAAGTGAVTMSSAASGLSSLEINAGSASTIAGAISGATSTLTQQGSGTLTLTGSNSYGGSTTINSSTTLQIGDGGTSGTLGTGGAVNDNGTLVFNRSNDLAVDNAIGGTGALTKAAGNTLTLTANGTYSGATTISTGTLVLQNNAPTKSTSGFNGTGTLRIEPASTSFTNAFSTTGWTFASTLGGLTLGKAGNTAGITIASAATVAGPISIYGGAVAINAALTATGSTITLTDSGATTETGGSVNASNLLLNGSGNYTLDTATVSTVAASGVGSVSLTNTGALTVGTVGSTHGISASSTVAVKTTTGDLTVSQSVATTATSTAAVVLDSGVGDAVGSTTDNIILSGSATITTGAGGQAVLYTGSVAGSTGVTDLVGAGSGKFRYNSKLGASNFTLALGSSGTYAVYREQPTLSITASPQTITYGSAQANTVTVADANGDTAVQALGTQATVAADGTLSTSSHLIAGTHTLTPSGAVAQLGQLLSYTTGTLTVSQLALSGAIASGSSTYGSTLSPGAVTFSNKLTADVVTDTAAVNTSTLSAAGKVVAGTYTQTAGTSLSGADAGNYSFAGVTSAVNYTVNPLAITGSIATGSSIYGATLTPGASSLSGVLSSDVVNTDAVSVNTTGNTSTAGKLKAASYTGIESVGSTLTGADSANYTFAGAVGNYTVSALALSGSVASSSSTYGSTVTPGAVTFDNKLAGDVVTASVSVSNPVYSTSTHLNAGAYAQTTSTALTGTDAGNYTLSAYTTPGNTYTVNPLAITVAAIAAASSTYGSAVAPGAVNLSGVIGSDVATTTASITNPVYSTSGSVAAGAYAQSASTTITGTDKANYTLAAFSTNGSNYTVSPLNLSVTGPSASSKTYDAATAATLTGTASVSASTNDLVSVGGTASASFASANAGTGIAITVAGYTLSGLDAANYSVVQPTGLTANITRAPLTITANSDVKFVTTADNVETYNGVNYTGLVGGELSSVVTPGTVTRTGMGASSGSGDAANTYPVVLVPSGYSASNYTISFANGDYTIVPAKQLLVNVANTTAVYGATPSYSITSAQYLNGSSVLTGLTKQSSSGNTSTWTDGAGGTVLFTLAPASALSTSLNQKVGNYAIAGTNTVITGSNFTALNFIGNLAVTQAPLTANASNVSKPYDGNVAMNGVTIGLTGQITSDVITVSGSGAFSSPHAGTGRNYSLSSLALGGTDASNYYLSGGTQLSGSNGVITPVSLTATLSNTGITKVYDGTVNAPAGFVAAYSVAGLVTGDAGVASVSLSNTGSTYATANAGAGSLTTAGLSISSLAGGLGSLPSDYVLSANSITTSAAISKAPLTVTAVVASKTYDGTLTAAGTGTVGTLAGAGDSVNNAGSEVFLDKNAGTGNKTVRASGVTIKDAADADMSGNYTISYTDNTVSTISKADLGVTGITALDKIY
ncbi:MAG: YDG domain-containing protein, partial [Betaproteobacteria bacterium]